MSGKYGEDFCIWETFYKDNEYLSWFSNSYTSWQLGKFILVCLSVFPGSTCMILFPSHTLHHCLLLPLSIKWIAMIQTGERVVQQWGVALMYKTLRFDLWPCVSYTASSTETKYTAAVFYKNSIFCLSLTPLGSCTVKLQF